MMFMLRVVLFLLSSILFIFFFFKQKTAYEMRISDWSSDVCSSDLDASGQWRHLRSAHRAVNHRGDVRGCHREFACDCGQDADLALSSFLLAGIARDRKSVV